MPMPVNGQNNAKQFSMLEKRVHAYFADNTALRQKVRQLEATNRQLTAQLHRAQGTQQPTMAQENGSK